MKDWILTILIMFALAAGIYFIADDEDKLFLAGMVIIWPVVIFLVAMLYNKIFNTP